MSYFAHSGNGERRDGRWETVREHVEAVSCAAAEFAKVFGGEEQAKAAGLLHDLGKYSSQFQRRLKDWREKSRDHWTLGALTCLKTSKEFGHFPAVAILGHHVGLDEVRSHKTLLVSLTTKVQNEPTLFTTSSPDENAQAIRLHKEDGLPLPVVRQGRTLQHDYVADMLDIRMLFSALVDADFLETEAHFRGDASTPRRPREKGRELNVEQAMDAFDRYMARFQYPNPTSFQSLRRQLLETCRSAGKRLGMGAFTLSAPTGSGKTLAMLGFALEHACRHGLRRIVLVMPFLNIIDQTAKIYRQIFDADSFGEDFLLEAHSLASRPASVDSGSQDVAQDDTQWRPIGRRMLAENWDAPVVLTTNVQLLESMFAHRPGTCRKLHRLAGSVILFDEVQTLPPRLALPTLAALNRLADPAGPYRSTVVFATATQPAFDALSPRLGELVDQSLLNRPVSQWKPTEIVADHDSLFAKSATRVSVEWKDAKPVAISTVAEQLAKRKQALCIVNLKRHAIELAEAVGKLVEREGVFHLSTNMCTDHRLQVLSQVVSRLKLDQPALLVATQCVEAGVDVDFPFVFRALAPLESIAQAAGRCNRNGGPKAGKVIVFSVDDPDDQGQQRRVYPPGYDMAVRATTSFLNRLRYEFGNELPEIVHSPERLREYYRTLYSLEGRGESMTSDEQELFDAILSGSFVEVAKRFRLIHENTINILVPYDRLRFNRLIEEGNQRGDLTPKQIRR